MTLYVLDTDTLTLFQRGHPSVCQRCNTCQPGAIALTIISVEELLSGWYTLLRRTTQPDQLARVYDRMTETVRLLAPLEVVSFPEQAFHRFRQLRAQKLKVGNSDLCIAAIVLEKGQPCSCATRGIFNTFPICK